MKFKKKPVIIDAYQTTEETCIETLEGVMTASPGDWIITGVNGETYPCKPDIFAKIYEAAARKPTIYFDLDGVLGNFDKRAEAIIGTDNIYKFEFVYGPEAFWKALNSDPFFFENMEVMPGAWRLIRATRKYPRGIITALPKTNAETIDRQKRAWVREHFGPMANNVITCLTKDKPNYCQPGDVLIDDRAVNKAAWEAKGGRYVIHTSAESTLEQLKSMGVELT